MSVTDFTSCDLRKGISNSRKKAGTEDRACFVLSLMCNLILCYKKTSMAKQICLRSSFPTQTFPPKILQQHWAQMHWSSSFTFTHTSKALQQRFFDWRATCTLSIAFNLNRHYFKLYQGYFRKTKPTQLGQLFPIFSHLPPHLQLQSTVLMSTLGTAALHLD